MQPLTTNCDSQEEQGTFETIRELDYNIFDKEGVKLPFSYFYTNSKSETLLHNITYTLNINDTANIDFTLGGTNNKELKPLCSRFCDNIIIHFIIPEDIIKNNKALKNYIKRKGTNDQPEENTPKSKEDRQFNKVLKEITPFLANNTEIIRELFNKFDILINKTSIKPTSFKVDKGTIKQFIKISLQDVPLDKVLNIVCNKERIKEFNDNGIFINDIEIIQDFSGTINKKDVIDYLLTKPDFRKEGEESINNNTTEEPIKIIIDNNASVGSNCLTFITNSSFGAVRYNFYNKFAQAIESPNVRGSVGNHYSHWINNQEQILKDNIKKSLDTGILRLEITYYIDNQAITEEYINKHLDYFVYILPPNLIFYNSISKQWSLLLNAIKYNLCVVDLDYNLALFSYSINKLTNNINGFYIKNVNTNKLSNILKLYSFNYPIILVSFKRTIEEGNDNLLIKQRIYTKELINTINKSFVLNELITYISNGNTYFTPFITKDTTIKAEDVGLLDCPICRLRLQPKKNINQFTTYNIPIVFKPIDNISKITKLLKKDKEENLFKNAREELINELIKQKEEESNQQIQDTTKIKSMFINSFNDTLNSNKHKLIELENKTHLFVYAFKFIFTRYGNKALLLCSKQNNIGSESNLSIYWSVNSVYDYLRENINKWTEIANNIYGSSLGIPIMEIEKEGVYYNASRNLRAKINIVNSTTTRDEIHVNQPLEYYTNTAIDKEVPNNIKDDNILTHNSYRKGKHEPIDKLVKEGDAIEIFNTFEYKGSYLISFRLDGKELTAKSTRFLDDIIKDKESVFKVVVGALKMHPISRRHCYYFIS